MKIDILSDLHFDYYFNQKNTIEDIKSFYKNIFQKSNRTLGEILIIAGDLGHNNKQNINILKMFHQQFYKHIICVLGNHDYYLIQEDKRNFRLDSLKRVEQMRQLINQEDGLYCLDGDVVEIDGIKFGGCDSWYSDDYTKEDRNSLNFIWRNSMIDGESIYGVKYFDDIFKIEKQKIELVYDKCDVMITHISPSIKEEHFSKEYKGDITNTFFSFDGSKYLKSGSMKYWIFGHMHDAKQFEEFGVKCICNPLGNPKEIESNITEVISIEI